VCFYVRANASHSESLDAHSSTRDILAAVLCGKGCDRQAQTCISSSTRPLVANGGTKERQNLSSMNKVPSVPSSVGLPSVMSLECERRSFVMSVLLEHPRFEIYSSVVLTIVLVFDAVVRGSQTSSKTPISCPSLRYVKKGINEHIPTGIL
jgi:hypothetical protein